MSNIECTGYLTSSNDTPYMCYRCLGDTSVLWVFVEDGNVEDEQYLCESCADVIAAGTPLGRLRLKVVNQ